MQTKRIGKKKPDNTVKVLFWSSIGGLLLRYYWPAIDKWLTEPIPAPQQVYPLVQPVSPQIELPPLPHLSFQKRGRGSFLRSSEAWGNRN